MRLVSGSIRVSVLSVAIAVAVTGFEAEGQSRRSVGDARVPASFDTSPLRFEKNVGQSDASVEFIARGAGYAFFVTRTETVTVLHKNITEVSAPAVVRMQLSGARSPSSIEQEELLPGKSHYFIGNETSSWKTGVSQYARVRMTEMYRGIDVLYYGNQDQIEYDFIVKPGSDPRQIRLRFEGAEPIEIDRSGDLVLHVDGGQLRQKRPVAYQELSGIRRPVPASYDRVGSNEFAIRLAAYDTARPLVIDPILSWSTYLGGNADDFGAGIALDGSGNIYVTGATSSTNFPVAGAIQTSLDGVADAFVTKLDPSGSLLYSTYLGGSGVDTGFAITADPDGNAYVTGLTNSTGFPMVNPIQATLGGGVDAFVTKLNPAGSALVFSTFLGGSLRDAGSAIALDGSRNVYVTGDTQSANFPTANALQAARNGTNDVFVTKINAAGSALVYSTYLGGSGTGTDGPRDIAVDAAGSAYVVGFTSTTDFPVANALQATNAGERDGFVTKFNAAGTALVYSTYLGGSGSDQINAIAVDSAGNVYVAGDTESTNFPTANALQPANAGGRDAVALKLNAAGTALVYSTYLGGTGHDTFDGIALHPTGDVYLAGSSPGSGFPFVEPMQAHGGDFDVVVVRMNGAGSALRFSTPIGGSGTDFPAEIALDSSGDAYVVGSTASTDFPTTAGAVQAENGGGFDSFVLTLTSVPAVSAIDPGTGPTAGGTVVTITGANFIPGATTISFGGTAATAVNCSSSTTCSATSPAGTGTVDVTATTVDGTSADTAADDFTYIAPTSLSISKVVNGPAFVGEPMTYVITVSNAGPAAAPSVVVTDVLPGGVTFSSATPSQGSCSGSTTVTCSLGALGVGGTATITLIVTPSAAGFVSNTATVSAAPQVNLNAANSSSTVRVDVQFEVAIPTLGEWMLLFLALAMASAGVLAIRGS